MRQMIVVSSSSWEATEGHLSCWETAPSKWQVVKESLPVSLGKSGMGWGRGLHVSDLAGPQKREGDMRSPAGVFDLKLGFSNQPIQISFPFLLIKEEWECIDDVHSKFYNQFVKGSEVVKDWNSSEKMHLQEGLYDRGIVIEHNRDPALAGFGSCLFMHIWRSPGAPTAGCTGLSQENLEGILSWLDPQKKPILVQIPTLVPLGLFSTVVVPVLQAQKLPLELPYT